MKAVVQMVRSMRDSGSVPVLVGVSRSCMCSAQHVLGHVNCKSEVINSQYIDSNRFLNMKQAREIGIKDNAALELLFGVADEHYTNKHERPTVNLKRWLQTRGSLWLDDYLTVRQVHSRVPTAFQVPLSSSIASPPTTVGPSAPPAPPLVAPATQAPSLVAPATQAPSLVAPATPAPPLLAPAIVALQAQPATSAPPNYYYYYYYHHNPEWHKWSEPSSTTTKPLDQEPLNPKWHDDVNSKTMSDVNNGETNATNEDDGGDNDNDAVADGKPNESTSFIKKVFKLFDGYMAGNLGVS